MSTTVTVKSETAGAPAEATESDTAGLRPWSVRPVSSRTMLVGLALVTILASAAALWFRAEAGGNEHPAVAASFDESEAAAVTDDISGAMSRLWSYDHRSLRGVRSLESITTPDFLAEYRPVYRRILQLAPATQAVVKARVTGAGVIALDGDRATVLVFLDQRATKDGGAPTTAEARLRIDAALVDGTWLVDGVTPF